MSFIVRAEKGEGVFREIIDGYMDCFIKISNDFNEIFPHHSCGMQEITSSKTKPST